MQIRREIWIVVIFFVAGWIVNILGGLIPYFYLSDMGPKGYDFYSKIFPGLGYTIMAIGAAIAASKFLQAPPKSMSFAGLQVELNEVIKRVQEEPDKVKPAWD